jgi:hypothetical protein
MDVLPVILGLFGFMISLHGLVTLLPACWADFTVNIGVLECLDETIDFINAAADWSVIA